MRDLAIIIPTRGRPQNIERVIEAWHFTNAFSVADMILAVDADDPEINGYRSVTPGIDGVTSVEHPEWLPMVHKLDATARSVSAEYWAIGFAGDDHVPRTIGWAAVYLTSLRELGTGMVYGDDGYQGVKLSTEWAVTSDCIRALNRMVPAPVEHMYCDNSILNLFTAVGAVRHLAHVRIEHMHPIAKKAQSDDQYKRVNSSEQFKKDRRSYEKWHSSQMAADVELIRALSPSRPSSVRAARPVRTRPPRIQSDSRRDRENHKMRSAPKRKGSAMSIRVEGVPREFRNVTGATPDEIGIALADMAKSVPADQAIVEIGVYQGRTALLMAWGARQGNGAHLWAYDAWELAENTYAPPFKTIESRNWANWNINALGYSDAITLTQGFSVDCAQAWSGPEIQLLFIDADHSYEGARNDVIAWSKHLAPGAIIALDDYGHPDWPGVKQAVDELVANGILAPIEIFHERLAVTRLTELPIVASAYASEFSETQAKSIELPEADQPAASASTVRAGELGSVPSGTALAALSAHQLRALATARGVTLPAGRLTTRQMIAALAGL